ncbi:efflux transporter outer membrane subunit [Sphingomonas crocodyli]|uniref:Efflux transporter outer membrane subunit n=1 Tax=Sphingomonas crocodyli TaxID=1979270 RepID=A0A437LUX7_9SPHN|nr:efflux transporter outer membrane subunit [Sphingomonas crocodyli]RVT89103.1 efflux transporter outer membrane subunit [Sphingomonas crocodyli]
MRKTIILLTATMLAGCNMAPKYVRPALPVPAELPREANEAGTDAVQPADLAWRDFFVDDRLRQLIALALDNNRDLRIALANVEQARAQFRVQQADIFPTIGTTGTATYQKSPAGLAGLGGGAGGIGGGIGAGAGAAAGGSTRFDIYQANVGISAWEIDLFGRTRNLTKAAQEQYFASRANRDAAQTALVAQTATAWLTMAADQERLRIARDTLKAFGETLEITRGRAREGIASDLEVRQAQTSYDQARSDIASITTVVAQDRNMLNLLAGTTVGADLLPNGLDTVDTTIANLPADLSSEVLLRRPDIAAAEHQLRAANANIGAARAAFFPKISLTAAFGSLSLGLSNLFGDGSTMWSVAPSATLPIFDFGRNAGNLRYAKATKDAMIATYEKAVQSGFREVADALARRGTIDEQLDAQRSLEDSAGAAYRIAHGRYQEGVDPFLTTLDSQRSWYSAQQSLVATRLARQSNSVELYRALGGGLR